MVGINGKKIITGMAVTVLAMASGWIAGSTECQAVNTAYDTETEAAYATTYKDIFYDRVAGSPLESEPEDGVDTATGHLMLTRTDLTLEGAGGMDFELSRYYNSNEAGIGYPTVEAVKELEVDTYKVYFHTGEGELHNIIVSSAIYHDHNDAVKGMVTEPVKVTDWKDKTVKGTQRTKVLSHYSHNVYGISTGWSYDLPWIETITVKEGDGSGWAEKPVYLHMGSRGTMPVRTSRNEAGKNYTITGLEGYDYQDIKLESINRTVDGVACRYLLRDKTGRRTYFNADGVVALQKDAHDNTIRYTYRDHIYFDTITDSVGRNIVFHYGKEENGMRFLEKVTVQGTKTAGGISGKTIRYTISGTTYQTLHSQKLYGCILKSVTVDGEKETYGYRTVESLVNAAGAGVASQRAATNETYLIKSIESGGSITHYEYRAGGIRGSREAGAGQKRDVVTQFFYVTREYQQDAGTKKKANGTKYDYFQKQNDTLTAFDDLTDEAHEVWQYGEEGLKALAVVSSYNPKKHKDNGKMSDYTYQKSSLDAAALHLKKRPKKDVSLYQYNKNKMQAAYVDDGKKMTEYLYKYDQNDGGSLVVQEIHREYGAAKNSRPKEKKYGYAYDETGYRNVIEIKGPKAYMSQYRGREALFTQTASYYHLADGYPDDDRGYHLCTVKAYESYADSTVKSRIVNTLSSNGIDIASESQQIRKGNGSYKTLSKTCYTYDGKGNETERKNYPDLEADPHSYTANAYQYNAMAQLVKQDREIHSAKGSSQNKKYTQGIMTYDSFGNELTYTDQDGIVSRTTYDEETGETAAETSAADTPHETGEESYTSADGLSHMTLDHFGRCFVEIKDVFGNTVICKDEKEGTWTESEYDYGEEKETADEEEAEAEDPSGEMVEERVYAFDPEGKAVTETSGGEKEIHYDIRGRSREILRGSRHQYDSYGGEIVTAEFSGGAMDAEHCSSWVVNKDTEEIEETGSVLTFYEKTLDPAAYQKKADSETYYTQFDDHVLSEQITVVRLDGEGNTLSRTVTVYCDGEKQETAESYDYDAFDKVTSDHASVRSYRDGAWMQTQEVKHTYQYDDMGNVTTTTTQSRLSDQDPWEQQVTKAVYDHQGQLVESAAPRGIAEGYATKYEYDLQGRVIREWNPVTVDKGTLQYQQVTTEYDEDGNVTAEEEQLAEDSVSRTEYTYNDQGELVCVKCCTEDDAQSYYTQYVYDAEGNLVRQFTGMTRPLTITVSKGDGEDSFHCAGQTYHLSVSGANKKDQYSETRYTYNKKGQLISETDPEGNKETYQYDIYGNQTSITDKNGNKTTYTYDHQGRLLTQTGKDEETGKKETHRYQYDGYGNVVKDNDIQYTYHNISGLIKHEETKIAGKKVTKSYTYDSGDNCRSFQISVGGSTELSMAYEYDGFSRLSRVRLKDGSTVRLAASYTYDEDGSLVSGRSEGAGLQTDYHYNCAGDLTELTSQTSSAGNISRYTSAYRLNGQKVSGQSAWNTRDGKTKKGESAYTYDKMGRLLSENHSGEEMISYTYDSHSNRSTMTQGNQKISYTYNKRDELLRTDCLDIKTKQDAVTLYKYDNNGNQLAVVHRRPVSGDKPEFHLDLSLGQNRLNENVVNHYDVQDQLSRVLTGNSKLSCQYDADGYRTSKTVNGTTTYFVWDDDQIVMELDEKGNVRKRYIRGNSLISADSGEGTESIYYVMNDHGDVAQLLDQSGNVIREYAYDSFGNEISPDKKDDNPYRYAGEYFDRETGNIYLRSRYYSPEQGRFLTMDTYTGEESDPLSLHRYAYCDNDGVNQVDPSGHWGRKKGFGYKGDRFVHKSITIGAWSPYLNQSFNNRYIPVENGKVVQLVKSNKKIILDGSVLPDFVFEKKKQKKQKNKLEDKYGKKYYLDYMSYSIKLKLLGEKIWDYDKYNGKTKAGQKYFLRAGLCRFQGPYKKSEKFLYLGCVLHSIQDYQAHSHVGELKEYKDYLKKNHSRKKNQKIDEFHSDWYYGVPQSKKNQKSSKRKKKNIDNNKKRKKKVAQKKELHREYKDNPNKAFIYDSGTGNWTWVSVNSPEKNYRYVAARHNSTVYLRKVLKLIK